MKYFALALAIAASAAHADTEYWDLYKGSRIIGKYLSYNECVAAGRATKGKTSCVYRVQVDPPPAPPPPPPVIDPAPVKDPPMTMGPYVDKSKYATVDPAHKYTTNRIASVWGYHEDATRVGNNPMDGWWTDCLPGSRPDCQLIGAAGSYLASPSNPDDIGAFREFMFFAGMSNDDPIVFPGQPGASHSHTFFGNFVNAYTTSANIRDAEWCANTGGKLNCTATWVPTMVDTRDGTPLVPWGSLGYYKGSYLTPAVASRNIIPVPTGLHAIAGDPKNSTGDAKRTHYICYGPNGENPGHAGTITGAIALGQCVPGGRLIMEVEFPICWDGVNLDSPDHRSHMTDPVNGACPSTHPVQIPTLTVNAEYHIKDTDDVTKWRLASDMYDPSLPAGMSGHADYMYGWDDATVKQWTTGCINAQRDCHAHLLGDDLHMLY